MNSKTICVLCLLACALCACTAQVGGAVAATDTTDGPTTPKALLAKLRLCQSRIENVQFRVEYDEHQYVDVMAELEKAGKLPEILKKYPRRKHVHVPHCRKAHRIAFDNKGRGRFEMTGGTYTETGQYVPTGGRRILLWDLEKAFDFNERPNMQPSTTIGTEAPFEMSKRFARPQRTFGGNLMDALATAIEQGIEVEMARLDDGKLKVTFKRNRGTQVGVIDPKCGYSVVLQERFADDGVLLNRYAADFKEVKAGIWFPAGGTAVRYERDGSGKQRYSMSAKLTEVRINDPKFDESVFSTMDMPKGTRVIDGRWGMEYIVGDPGSLKPYPPKHRAQQTAPHKGAAGGCGTRESQGDTDGG